MFNLKRFNSPQEPFESSEDFRTETWKQDVKACFNRRFVFRLWQILVFLLIIVTVVGILAAMLGARQPSSKPNSYRAAKAKETKKNGGNPLSSDDSDQKLVFTVVYSDHLVKT